MVRKYSFDELRNNIVEYHKGTVPVHKKIYGEITHPEKFDYHVFRKVNDTSTIYQVKPYELYDCYGGCFSKEAVDITKYGHIL